MKAGKTATDGFNLFWIEGITGYLILYMAETLVKMVLNTYYEYY